MSSLAGQTFAGYEIICELGKGGMGAVYKARQPMLNRFVALKMMAPSLSGDPAFVARFIREASAAANLNHPNMVQVYTAGESDKVYYIAMEFVEGESLRIRLDRMGRIPAQEAVAITVYVAQALQYAWNKAHLIHRDIKPDNIFLSNAGEVKVGDLGLAKSVGGEATDVTQTGMLMGSPHYISPEQAQAAKDLDFRADIYSLGCTLYHILTGKTPYQGESAMAIVMKHVNEPPPAIFKVWPACPMPLGRLVGKMVAKHRHERHQSYEDLIADLMQVHEKLRQSESIAPVATTPTPVVADTVPRAKKTDTGVTAQAKAGSKKLIYAAAGICATAALAGLLWWSPWKAGQEASGKGQAETGSESRLQAESAKRPPAKSGTPTVAPPEPPRQETVAPITSPAPAPPSTPVADSVPTTPQPAMSPAAPDSQPPVSPAPTPAALASVPTAQTSDGFQPLFNGRDLTGWSPRAIIARKGAKHIYQPTVGGWMVRNGELVCTGDLSSQPSQTDSKDPPTFYLRSDEQYGDFVLQLEFKSCPNGHSGLYIRCSEAGNISLDTGMKIPIMDAAYAGRMPRSPKYRTGAISFVTAGPEPPLRATGQWNSMEIRCEGDNVEVTVNGTRTATADMSQEPKLRSCPRSGYIGIANWCCEANGMSFRNIRIKELSASSAAPVTPHSSLLTPTNDAFADEVAALPPVQQIARVIAKLKELNPNFDGKQTHKLEGGAVTELAISTVGLRNLAPVSALKQLKKLTITPWVTNQKGVLADLSPLRELPLAWLYCQNNPITDLSPLKSLPLTVLGCGGTQVSDLSPLAGMKLTVLSINDTTVSDLSPLGGMPLTTLWCNNTKVTDLSPLASSPLQELRCDYKPRRDAEALRGIPTLRKLNDQLAAALLKQAAASTAGGDIRALIVTGVDLPAHDWRATGPVIRNELQKDPRMKVEILNDIYRLDSMDLTKFQAVLLNFYTRGKPDPNEQARENLKNFVNHGGGLVIFHSTCGSFRDWPEFRDLAGKIMDSQKGGYDKQGPMRVKIANANHPITRGMQPFETNDELYAFLSGRKAVQVLATAHAKSTGSDEPMAFVFDYGKGRVFHFVLGHDVRAIQTDGTAELLRRGTAWAAGRDPVPLITPQRPVR